jgi:hypothetical protein
MPLHSVIADIGDNAPLPPISLLVYVLLSQMSLCVLFLSFQSNEIKPVIYFTFRVFRQNVLVP